MLGGCYTHNYFFLSQNLVFITATINILGGSIIILLNPYFEHLVCYELVSVLSNYTSPKLSVL